MDDRIFKAEGKSLKPHVIRNSYKKMLLALLPQVSKKKLKTISQGELAWRSTLADWSEQYVDQHISNIKKKGRAAANQLAIQEIEKLELKK